MRELKRRLMVARGRRWMVGKKSRMARKILGACQRFRGLRAGVVGGPTSLGIELIEVRDSIAPSDQYSGAGAGAGRFGLER